jgi:hypothetical protein
MGVSPSQAFWLAVTNLFGIGSASNKLIDAKKIAPMVKKRKHPINSASIKLFFINKKATYVASFKRVQ